MISKRRILLLIVLIICLESLIYLWAYWTSTFDKSNFFAIESEFITDKCARNSGRVSSFINLTILLMIGYYGLLAIYSDEKKRDQLCILVTLFAVNHLTHFLFVFLNFKNHHLHLEASKNLQGFIIFLCVVALPIALWSVKKMNQVLYFLIILHLFNASYFIMETFYNKITPEKPAYHNQFGILVTSLALLYVLYGVFREYRSCVNRPLKSS